MTKPKGGYTPEAKRRRALRDHERHRRVMSADDPRHGSVNGYSNGGCRCVPCGAAHRVYQAAYQAANHEALRARRYGLTVPQLRAAIGDGSCWYPPCPNPGVAVDHDHDTDDVRGYLCMAHNTALGVFHDDPAELRAFVGYLEAGTDYRALDV